MTEPIYFFTSSGCFWIASEIGQKITPISFNFSLKVVATETLSKTASTATPARTFCSVRGIPNFLYVSSSFGSTSSNDFGFSLKSLGDE